MTSQLWWNDAFSWLGHEITSVQDVVRLVVDASAWLRDLHERSSANDTAGTHLAGSSADDRRQLSHGRLRSKRRCNKRTEDDRSDLERERAIAAFASCEANELVGSMTTKAFTHDDAGEIDDAVA